jgi:oxygen-independent coproporphyrinogen III oxidase
MAGIYLHIPFCKQACHYCNFHFSTTFESYRAGMINALQKEISLRAEFFGTTSRMLDSVYFGGGTPSLLTAAEHQTIWETIFRHFSLKPGAEVTFEANPDDMTDAWLQELRNTPVNRLSIGIQSFHEPDLQYLHRVHNSLQAREAIRKAMQAGIRAISADLIFGIPGSGPHRLEHDARLLTQLGVDHISAYGLTVEPRTALEKMIGLGKRKAVDEEQSAAEMEFIMQLLPDLGFEQYEISNFAVPGHEAVHNSHYWSGQPYLGIGPGAHSFQGNIRSWNPPNNAAYMNSIQRGVLALEAEVLSIRDQFNEMIMTRLRTAQGIGFSDIKTRFGRSYQHHFLTEIRPFLHSGDVTEHAGYYQLSFQGRLKADFISQQLFIIDEN